MNIKKTGFANIGLILLIIGAIVSLGIVFLFTMMPSDGSIPPIIIIAMVIGTILICYILFLMNNSNEDNSEDKSSEQKTEAKQKTGDLLTYISIIIVVILILIEGIGSLINMFSN